MSAPQPIQELMERFDEHKDAYKSPSYNEAHVRQDFLGPFFKALRWDMENTNSHSETYRDVIHEDTILIGATKKAPDYSFRLQGVRKFFVEAKKPSVPIKIDHKPAYQLRRYGWNAKLPLSIVTDFEEFAVYDCRIKPSESDNAGRARILYFTYDQYNEKWDDIQNLFSKDAVQSGSLDKYLQANEKKGTTQVDDEFLKDIERWRELLAKDLAHKNQLTERELNQAVQATIDRLIFLRICEDRGIEEYGRLQSIAKRKNIYASLLRYFGEADDRYNSGLFHFRSEKDRNSQIDTLTPSLKIADDSLNEIISGFYYPSPYEFSIIPSDILGSVYERFLGKVITLNASNQAVIEEKPEVKKAGGVYYTPTYIVQEIVKDTVGAALEGKTPAKVSKIKVLDPACGSGSFLLVVYQYLLEWHKKYYVDSGVEKYKKEIFQTATGWELTTSERKRILLNNIHGVDIDMQAVEVTKLSLLLKVLEGENKETINKQLQLFKQRALPDLDNNIKCGNSIISSDFYAQLTVDFSDDQSSKVNVFDWNKEFKDVMDDGGFDIVVANPPYGAKLSAEEKEYLGNKFDVGSTDTAALFMSHFYDLTKVKGYNGFIVPKPFVYASNWKKLRDKLAGDIQSITDCGKVWKEVKLEQVIYISQKNKGVAAYESKVREGKEFKPLGALDKGLINEFGFLPSGVSEEEISLALKIRKTSDFLGGLSRNARGSYLQKSVKEKASDYKVIGGKQVNRFLLNGSKGWIDKKEVTEENAFIKPNAVLCQNIIAHIEKPVDRIKIIATTSPSDYKDYVIIDTVNQITVDPSVSSKYICALLNSRIINWYVYRFIYAKAIRTMHFDNPVTSRIPVPKHGLTGEMYAQIVSLAERAGDLHQKKSLAKDSHSKNQLQRQIEAAEHQIDACFYSQFSLTDEEIRRVERAA